MLETVQKMVGQSCPSHPANGESIFWFAFMVRNQHSCGTSRKNGFKLPSSKLGRSTSAVTSFQQRIIVHRRETSGACSSLQLAHDVGAAFGEAGR